MNGTKKVQPGKDPELLRVKLSMCIDYPDRDSDIGPVVELENDGVTTKFAYGPEPEDFRLILQTRSAFRGMCGALTDLGLAELMSGEGVCREVEEGGENG